MMIIIAHRRNFRAGINCAQRRWVGIGMYVCVRIRASEEGGRAGVCVGVDVYSLVRHVMCVDRSFVDLFGARAHLRYLCVRSCIIIIISRLPLP